MTESPQSWQAFLEWLWDYGNQRHIAKAEYEGESPSSLQTFYCANTRIASLRRLNTTTKSQSKRQHAQKPLLHQVLRTASFKAQRGPKMKPKKLAHMTKAADTVMDSVDGMPTPRPALHPADPNGQIGKSEQVPSTTADDGAKHLTMRSRAW